MSKKPKMPSDATIRRRLRELRVLIEADSTPLLERRMAYEIECAIRWARERTVGWPSPVNMALRGSELLRDELRRDRP